MRSSIVMENAAERVALQPRAASVLSDTPRRPCRPPPSQPRCGPGRAGTACAWSRAPSEAPPSRHQQADPDEPPTLLTDRYRSQQAQREARHERSIEPPLHGPGQQDLREREESEADQARHDQEELRCHGQGRAPHAGTGPRRSSPATAVAAKAICSSRCMGTAPAPELASGHHPSLQANSDTRIEVRHASARRQDGRSASSL